MYTQRIDFFNNDKTRRIELDMNEDGIWITIRKWNCHLDDEFEDIKFTNEEAMVFANQIINMVKQNESLYKVIVNEKLNNAVVYLGNNKQELQDRIKALHWG